MQYFFIEISSLKTWINNHCATVENSIQKMINNLCADKTNGKLPEQTFVSLNYLGQLFCTVWKFADTLMLVQKLILKKKIYHVQ